jgi:hypothetical protein
MGNSRIQHLHHVDVGRRDSEETCLERVEICFLDAGNGRDQDTRKAPGERVMKDRRDDHQEDRANKLGCAVVWEVRGEDWREASGN